MRTSMTAGLLLLLPSCARNVPQSQAVHESGPQGVAVEASLMLPPGVASQHPTVNREALLAAFPLASLSKVRGDVISSARDLAVIEQVRERAAAKRDLGTGIPVDMFLWASGEPPEPHLTKLGGVPHRERDLEWPKNEAGEAMSFVAQFCFADSLDILKVKLPGDVLLVFFGEEWPYIVGDKYPGVHLEWSQTAIKNATRIEDVPTQGIEVPVLHGVRHRSNEFPSSFYGQDPDVFTELGYDASYHFAITQSTSIGHSTWFIQNDPTARGEHLIAALSSFQLKQPWPLANQEKLATLPELMFFDVGCYYFLLDRRGRVRIAFDSY